MTLISKALDGLGRWYVAVPPVLIIGLLAALFFIAGAGETRLQDAGRRLQSSAAREHAIDELRDALSTAVAAQRGYQLTGGANYLQRYEQARNDAERYFESLQRAYAGSQTDAGLVRLEALVGTRLDNLARLVAAQQQTSPSAALELMDIQAGTDTGRAVGDVLEQLRGQEGIEHIAASQHWAASLALSHWITFGGTVLSLLLVAVATRVVYSELRRQQLLTEELRDQKALLEQEVDVRTRELIELSTHLQSVAEREKADLARELHDELGGLLVGARMDVSWAEQRLSAHEADMRLRLNRANQNLAAGVDLKRRIIEELRPTLLDNVGLFAALRWQLKETCGNAGLKCLESYPEDEPKFNPEFAIALFRVAQEAFDNVLKHAAATTVSVSLTVDEDALRLRIADDGRGIKRERISASSSHGVASMRHRVRALGGRLELHAAAGGGSELLVHLPLVNALLQAAEPVNP